MSDIQKFVIESVIDTEQWGNKLWRITAPTFGSICIDATGRRPEPGDTMIVHMDGTNRVARTEVVAREAKP